MKKIFIISIILGLFYYILFSFIWAMPIETAIEPVYMVPSSYISGFLKSSPKYINITLFVIGFGLFFYSIYLFVGIVQKKTRNMWKSFYLTLIFTIALGYALVQPLFRGSILINYPIISVLIISTMLVFPIKRFKYLIVPYLTYIVSYLVLIEIFGNGLVLHIGIAMYLSPLFVIVLYLLTFQSIAGEKIYPYLALLLIFIPLKIKAKDRYKIYNNQQKTTGYTILVPVDDFYQIKKFDKPLSFSYYSILEPDSVNYYYRMYGVGAPYIYYNLNLNEKRIKIIEELLANKRVYIGKRQREKIQEKILKRWNEKKEIGVIQGKIDGDIPDRVGLLQKDLNVKFRWNSTFTGANVKDAVSPDERGNFIFRYVPEGKYSLVFLYKRKVPHYKIKVPIFISKNDSIDLGVIRIEK